MSDRRVNSHDPPADAGGTDLHHPINYIQANPVKAGLVKSAKDYPWSSFQAFYSAGEQSLPVDKEWWWPDDAEKLGKAVKELGWKK